MSTEGPGRPLRRRIYRLLAATLLIVLIAVLGIIAVAYLNPPDNSFNGPHSLLVEYHGTLVTTCYEGIKVYRDGRITYYCDDKEIASDTAPADKMTILLGLAARMRTTSFSATDFAHGETAYSMYFFGDAPSNAIESADDSALRLQTCRDLVEFMRQKYG